MAFEPSVSIVVVNYNGRHHLEPCLGSLLALDYPAERLEIVLADNGSTDGSVELVEAQFPGVRVVRFGENHGFARANNLAAAQACGAYLALLNNDARIAPDWLRRLLDQIEADPEVVCVGGKILDWTGERIDFAGAAMTFEGFGLARLHGQLVSFNCEAATPASQPALFACGGAMLIDRSIFSEVGGFDESYFAVYEDADLGWRLWLYGHKVAYAPAAVAFHRQSSTLNRLASAERQRLLQRNALLTILKNYDDANLAQILPAALLLAATRVGQITGAETPRDTTPGFYQLSVSNKTNQNGREPDRAVEALGLAAALADVGAQLPQVMARRQDVQRRRRRTDAEIFELFGHPLLCPATDWSYLKTHYEVTSVLGVAKVFDSVGRRVLVIASDIVPFPGCPTTGAGLRAWGIGKALERRGHQVLFALPQAAVEKFGEKLPPEVVHLAWTPETIMESVVQADPEVLIACNWPIAAMLGETHVPVALDQAGPHLLERHYSGHGDLLSNFQNKLPGLARADFFTCCGEWQRLYFLPWLQLAGFDLDDDRIHTIPYSMPPEMPVGERPAEPVFVYAGIYLPWTDPTAALATVIEELERRGQGQLDFVGGGHPLYEVDPGVFPNLVAKLAGNPRVTLSPVVPFDKLVDHCRRGSVAIDLMMPNAERKVALTTRTIVYLWSGLPVIYNDYSELSGLIREYSAGWTVDPTDRAALRNILSEIFENPDLVQERSVNAQRLVRERLNWDQTIEPLDRFVRNPAVRARRPTVTELMVEQAARDAAALEAQRRAAEEANQNRPMAEKAADALQHLRQGGLRRFLYYGFGFLAKQFADRPTGEGRQ